MGKSQLSAAKLEKSWITFENQYKIAVDVILRQRGKAIEINSLRWIESKRSSYLQKNTSLRKFKMILHSHFILTVLTIVMIGC